uniref:Uncharacterized protein n=1 Tax=viral metagenome TaxID=1070528 RepID=A0A6C0HI68_9ZZZZ
MQNMQNMQNNTFRFNDDLGNILARSPAPVMGKTATVKTKYEGFEDYMTVDISDYNIYSEKNPDISPKYTMISKAEYLQTPDSSETESQNTNISGVDSKEYPDYDDVPITTAPPVPDVIASKLLEQSKMSTINTVYIGSLTVIGLYVLFRYMKY